MTTALIDNAGRFTTYHILHVGSEMSYFTSQIILHLPKAKQSHLIVLSKHNRFTQFVSVKQTLDMKLK